MLRLNQIAQMAICRRVMCCLASLLYSIQMLSLKVLLKRRSKREWTRSWPNTKEQIMSKCGFVIHKTMPLALAQQLQMAQSKVDTTQSKTPSSSLPRISTQYKTLMPPSSTNFWYIKAWDYLKQKMSKG